MGHPLRWFLPHVVYETTIRTIQERFLLRPSGAARSLILGVLGRAQLLYPSVRLYAFAYLSNHAHLLVSADDGQQLASFLGFINGNVAREMGRLHNWRGPLWGRRHRPIPILDEDALVARLRYIISQGIKEGLVKSPRDWPGASAVPGLLADMVLEGVWYDRNSETRARRCGMNPDSDAFARKYPVCLTPLPQWAALSRLELVRRHETLVREVEIEAADQRRCVVGADFVQTEDPHASPASSKRSPAPCCHSTSSILRARFRAALRAFTHSFRAAASALRAATSRSLHLAPFPPGSFPPSLSHVAGPSAAPPPWVSIAIVGAH